VMCWMDTNALPCVTTPSRGTCRARRRFCFFFWGVMRTSVGVLLRSSRVSARRAFREKTGKHVRDAFCLAVVRRLRWVNG
jgi:hypothetical protein